MNLIILGIIIAGAGVAAFILSLLVGLGFAFADRDEEGILLVILSAIIGKLAFVVGVVIALIGIVKELSA